MLGELLLPVARWQQLTWPELDCLLHGQDVRRQKDMVAFRLIASQVYNALAKEPLAPHQYLPLPAVDGPPAGTRKSAGRAAWEARMKEKYGNLLEA